jgi:hypothetical protein
MAFRRVSVTSEDAKGRNRTFHDNVTHEELTRADFVQKIEQGEYDRYHVRVINGVKTPASNPDSSEHNNLG